ncbi:hypothetical protein [Micromonospora sp. NPDC004704]
MLRRSLQVFVMMLTATAMLVTAGTGASASGQVAVAKPSAAKIVTVSSVPDANSPEIRQITQALQAGQQVVLRATGGGSATLALNNGVIDVISASGTDQQLLGWCASSIAAFLFGLGAVAIGALAVASGGAGVTIAGFFVSTNALYGAAAVAGSYSALYAFIDSKVCN